MDVLVITLSVIAWLFLGAYGASKVYLEEEGCVKVGDIPAIFVLSLLGIIAFLVCMVWTYRDVVLCDVRKQKP